MAQEGTAWPHQRTPPDWADRPREWLMSRCGDRLVRDELYDLDKVELIELIKQIQIVSPDGNGELFSNGRKPNFDARASQQVSVGEFTALWAAY